MSTSEGNLEAPTRHAIDWLNPDFYDEDKLHAEMERAFDICHGCRRCVSLFVVRFQLCLIWLMKLKMAKCMASTSLNTIRSLSSVSCATSAT